MKDTLQSIRTHSLHFFSGTLLSRFSGMLRDISMAYVFGTTPAIAAFMIAFRFAHLLRRLFGEGALQTSFIPEFESLRHIDEKRAMTFFKDLNGLLTVFLIFIILCGSAVLGGLIWSGILSPSNYQVVFLTLLMLPSLLFICLYGLNMSFLQCERKYFIPSVAPVAFNIIWIACTLYLKNMPVEQAMPWLALGVVFACFCQWLLTVPQTIHSLKRILSCTFWISAKNFSSDVKRLTKPLALGILGVAATQINSAVDSLFARYAEAEGPAFLWYAIRIEQMPLALFGIAISGALLPPLSRAFKSKRTEEYLSFLQDALHQSWVFMLAMTAAIFVLGDTSVNFLYGRGDFGTESIIKTTYCLWAYASGLIPSALVLILAPACYAQNNYLLPALTSIFSMLLNIGLNSIFIFCLNWGAKSVALATSISAWINLFLLSKYLYRIELRFLSPYLIKKCLFHSIPSFIALIGTFLFRTLTDYPILFSQQLIFPQTFTSQIFALLLQGCSFFSFLILPIFATYPFSELGTILSGKKQRETIKSEINNLIDN